MLPTNFNKILLTGLLLLVASGTFAGGFFGKDRYKAKGAKSKEIDSLYFFEPLTQISLVDISNQAAACDSCSDIAGAQIKRIAAFFSSRMRLSAPERMADTGVSTSLKREIIYAMSEAEVDSFAEDIRPLNTIDSVLRAKHMRFGLIILNTGFVRTKASMKAVRKEANRKELISLGLLSVTPVQSRSLVWAMIIDAKEHRTYYYNTDGKRSLDDNPLNFNSVKAQFINLFSHFYWGDISGFDLSKIK